jgi:hypothetical protein
MEHLDFVIWTIGWLWLMMIIEKPKNDKTINLISYLIFKTMGLILWAYISIKLFNCTDSQSIFIYQYKWYNC